MIFYIYIHIINDKPYIGQTTDLKKRFNISSYKKSPKVYNAMKKYKYDFSETKILYEIDNQIEADNLEKEAIIKYDSIENGYNILNGGQKNTSLGFKHSEISKKRMSTSAKKRGTTNIDKFKFEKGCDAPNKKRIKCIETGKIYNSIKLAAIENGLKNYTSISNQLNGRSKSAAGLHFVFI